MGKNVSISQNVTFVEKEEFPITIGDQTIIRSGTVIYWGTNIGKEAQISHNVIIREFTKIGNKSVVGSLSDIEGYTTIGKEVTIHSQCFIPSQTTIKDYVFLGPGTVLTNTKKIKHGRDYPLVEKGPTIERAARIGARTLILPGITIGEDCFVAAGSVVTRDVPPRKVVMGFPAKIKKDVLPEEYQPNV
ncbi:MAG: DapH/DapD/GlmU-related protein [Promethearchaeota archaeon]